VSFNGAGTFVINSTGNPVVTGTVISSTWANALTADLATGLSTCVLKDGTQTTTASVPFASGITTPTGGTSTFTGALNKIMGTGSGTMTADGILNTQTSAAGVGNAADATDDTLFTYSLPLNSLVTNGQSIRTRAWGFIANNGNTKAVKLWFAGANPASSGVAVFTNAAFMAEMCITRIDATHVSCSSVIVINGVTPFVAIVANQAVSDLTANASIIKVTGASPGASTANDVLGYGMKTWGDT